MRQLIKKGTDGNFFSGMMMYVVNRITVGRMPTGRRRPDICAEI
jgi:hypothetical protein